MTNRRKQVGFCGLFLLENSSFMTFPRYLSLNHYVIVNGNPETAFTFLSSIF